MERASTIGTRERAWQKRQKARRDMQHATPDAPERVDPRRRCTRHDDRTCCRGSRGSASLPVATAVAAHNSNNSDKPSETCQVVMSNIKTRLFRRFSGANRCGLSKLFWTSKRDTERDVLVKMRGSTGSLSKAKRTGFSFTSNAGPIARFGLASLMVNENESNLRIWV